MNKQKIFIVLIIAAVISAWFIFDLNQYLNLSYIKAQQNALADLINDNFLTASLIFFSIYVLVTALSLPGALILTLLAAALFGFWWGLLLVSFASTIGATLAFIISRFLLRDWVQSRYGNNLKALNEGVKKDGAFYLFTLRLIPVVPFFMINLLMALTPIKTFTFYWVSQVGMLLGTIVFVNAGTQLADIQQISDILSPVLLSSFVLLGLFPWFAKMIINYFNNKKVYKKWTKPTKFDRNLIVIGAGSGGLVSSYIAAAAKAKVTLIEKAHMGGDCLNTGCVPSKAIIRAAHAAAEVDHASYFGIHTSDKKVDFQRVMRHVHESIKEIEPHDSVERYTGLGVECLQGSARIISPWEVELDGKVLSAPNIIIATGAHPFVPEIAGMEDVNYYSSDTIWQLTEQPKKLLVVGGGPIGCELAQSFARLGSEVTIIDRATQLLTREEPEAAKVLEEHIQKDGVTLSFQKEIVEFKNEDGKQFAHIKDEHGALEWLEFDAVLFAIGRRANTTGFGLEELNVELNPNGTIKVNDYLQTTYPNIYAVGDVAGPYQFTHAASHQAWYASVNALFGSIKRFKADYSVLPAVTYCSPEIARVGVTEAEAKAQGIAYEVTTYDFEELDRAIADHEAFGFIKVLTKEGSDKILGVTIVSTHAGDLLAEFTLAMRHKLGLNKILGTIHPYPTWSEANKYVAGNWKRNHVSEKLIKFAEKFHQWKIK